MNLAVPFQLIGATGGFYDTIGCIPKPATGTGTVAVTNNTTVVIGTGTLFLTQLNIGDWLYFPTTKQFGQVLDIASNTRLILDRNITPAVVAGELVKAMVPRFKRVKFANTGGAAATINGISYAAATGDEFPGVVYGEQSGVVPVILYNATGTTLTIIAE